MSSHEKRRPGRLERASGKDIEASSAIRTALGGLLLTLGVVVPGRSSGQFTCDQLADYSFFDGIFILNDDDELWLSGNVEWGMAFNGMAVHGTIVIPPGASLTIDGPRIQFASTYNMWYRTGIVVRPGGHLVLKGGAILTSLDECPGSIWEGISVMGTPGEPDASPLQGTVDIDHATISNAAAAVYAGYCLDNSAWYLEPPDHSGGVIRCRDAWFLNNIFGVVLRAHGPSENEGESLCHFFRCTFSTNADLNSSDFPIVFLTVEQRDHIRVGGCTFENDFHPWVETDATNWGSGILALNTSISILPLCDGEYVGLVPCEAPSQRTINVFRGLYKAVRITNISPDRYAEVVRASFAENIRGLEITGTSHSTVIRNLVSVPLDPGNIFMPRGMAFSNSTGFEVQENEIDGPANNDFSQPNTGMWFSNTGDGPNLYYKNQFFGPLTVGTIIQGVNQDEDVPGDGLQFKCNNYGVNDLSNEYDIALTGNPVSIGDKQGTGDDPSTAAGNTFSPSCELLDASHMWAEEGAVVPFKYWYHNPLSTVEKVYPECRPVNDMPELWFTNTEFSYENPSVCTSQTDLFTGGGGGVIVLEAEENYNLLREVYDEQSDGGDTEGLKDYIADPSHSGYDVRNQLMLVAPRVSSAVWSQVFVRDPAMNPWHLAQALLANVPLQPEVIRMMENSGIDPYYQQLVRNAQGNGINQLTIMESEMGHWRLRRERALNAMTLDALKTGTQTALQDALDYDEDHPQHGLPLNRLGLLMAKGELTDAKDIVDDILLAPHPDAGIEVLGIYLDLLIADQTIYDVSTSDRARVGNIAHTYGPGQGQAQAWLECLGEGPFPDEMILPDENRSMQASPETAPAPIELLATFPNPSDGKQAVYLVVRMPEGMEQATLRVVDPLGRIVRDEVISRAAAIIELEPGQLANGLYLASLFAGEIQLATSKFEVLR